MEKVISVNAEGFKDLAKKVPKFLAMFYTQISKQSRGFREQFGKALKTLGGPKVVAFVKVDCLLIADQQQGGKPLKVEVNRKLCSMHDVTGVPTLVWFDFTQYNGDI